MIQLIREEDVKKKGNKDIRKEEKTINILLIDKTEVIDKSKVSKIDKKTKVITKENTKKNKKYHLLRWKIKNFLMKENIIKNCMNWENVLDIFNSEIVNKDDLTDIEIKELFYRYGRYIIDHHTKYKEIHGVDDTTYMTRSEHRKLHIRLRREGKCNVPTNELAKIAQRAEFITEKRKERDRRYYRTDQGMEINRKSQQNVKRKFFLEKLGRNISLYEEFAYNIVTNTLTITSGFRGEHGLKLPRIKIE